MKKSLLFMLFFCLFGGALLLESCEDEDGTGEPRQVISRHFGESSHATGQNCMNCHRSGGEGEGIFTLAGTVYQADRTTPAPNGTVDLYTEADGQGQLVRTVEVDNRGNFFTTENIDLADSLYVRLISVDGIEKFKPVGIDEGACNRCHDGSGTPRIWID